MEDRPRTRWKEFTRSLYLHKHLYLFLIPTLGLVFTFSYYPMISGVYHSFFEWDGSTINEWVGMGNFKRVFRDGTLWLAFEHTLILMVANILKMIPSIITAVMLFRVKNAEARYIYRVLCVIPMIIPGMVNLLIWKFMYEPNVGFINTALGGLGLGALQQQWFGDPGTALFSYIMMGFPWFNVVGVLILLSGLEAISVDVFEAAEIDGIGSLGRFFYIELPLILPQIRINLTLLIIGTFRTYGNLLILTDGGPNNATIVPALHMFHRAFKYREMGYACAMGLVLFVFIISISYVLNKYLAVEK